MADWLQAVNRFELRTYTLYAGNDQVYGNSSVISNDYSRGAGDYSFFAKYHLLFTSASLIGHELVLYLEYHTKKENQHVKGSTQPRG